MAIDAAVQRQANRSTILTLNRISAKKYRKTYMFL